MNEPLSIIARMQGRVLATHASTVEVTPCDLLALRSGEGGTDRQPSARERFAAAGLAGLLSVSSVGGAQDVWPGVAARLTRFVDATSVNQAPWYEFRAALAHESVEVVGESEVRQYAETHPDLLAPTSAVCKAARGEFGWTASLALKLYRDPEFPDEYLVLYVRLPDYPADTLRRIRRVSELFGASLEDKSGNVLVTTDFRPTR